MDKIFHSNKNRLSNAIGRWAGVGPYYAMFPLTFAFEVVEEYCPRGGAVFDPFAGRASSLYAAAVTERKAYGIEINKVGWLYGFVKLNASPVEDVIVRNAELGEIAASITDIQLKELPLFFHLCYTQKVLKYLLAARQHLKWETNTSDSTLMALILVYLHGAKEKSLSNQMRQSKAMAPEYSINWWREHNSSAPDVNPVTFMETRIRWRYKHGTPSVEHNCILRGDSTVLSGEFISFQHANQVPKFDLLFTSPPYYNITSYHYDQWLRLWMLGESDTPTKSGGDWQNGFWSQTGYVELLNSVFTQAAELMKSTAVIYVRTDAREFTLNATLDALKSAFPSKQLQQKSRPLKRNNQTALYGDKSQKPGEVDIILI
jgi:hypothetical protein